MPLIASKANAGAFGLGWSAAGTGEELGGMVLLTPTSISYTGTSATIGANGSVEFTACSRIGLNGVFTSEYDNYQIVVRIKRDTAVGDDFLMRLMSGGVEATTNYTYQYLWANDTSVTPGHSTYTWFVLSRHYGEREQGLVVNVYGPALAQSTAIRSVTATDYLNAMITDYANTHSTTTAYDGLNLASGAGTSTGSISVYGVVGA